MEIKQQRSKTPEQALEALMTRCAKAEVCISDAKRLMFRWRVDISSHENIIDKLLAEKFIDEQRYAEAFVRDKMNFSRWGERKISEALYAKQIPSEIIKQAMGQIVPGSLTAKLEADLRRKMAGIKEENPYKLKEKLLRFGISRGFDYSTVTDVIDRITGDK